MGLHTLRRRPQRVLFPFCHRRTQQEDAICEPESPLQTLALLAPRSQTSQSLELGEIDSVVSETPSLWSSVTAVELRQYSNFHVQFLHMLPSYNSDTVHWTSHKIHIRAVEVAGVF